MRYSETLVNSVSNDISTEIVNKCTKNSYNSQNLKITIKNIKGCSLKIGSINQTLNSKVNIECINPDITLEKEQIKETMNNNLNNLKYELENSGIPELENLPKDIDFNGIYRMINSNSTVNKIVSSILENTTNIQNNEINIHDVECLPYIIVDAEGNEQIKGDELDLGNIEQFILNEKVKKAIDGVPQLANLYNSLNDKIDTILEQNAKLSKERKLQEQEREQEREQEPEEHDQGIIIGLSVFFSLLFVAIIGFLIYWFLIVKRMNFYPSVSEFQQ